MGDDPDTAWTFNEKFGRKVMLLYHKLKNGCSNELSGSDNYRLFFLLKGAVRLKVGNDGEYLLGNGEFTLLPRDVRLHALHSQARDMWLLTVTV